LEVILVQDFYIANKEYTERVEAGTAYRLFTWGVELLALPPLLQK